MLRLESFGGTILFHELDYSILRVLSAKSMRKFI